MGTKMKADSSKMHTCRTVLLAKREELIDRIYAHRSEITSVPTENSQAEVALHAVVRDLTYVSMENEIRTLAEVELSLHRLETGEYGLCGSCGESISTARLQAIPWTRVCLICAGGGIRRSPRCDAIQSPDNTERLPTNVIQFHRSPLQLKNEDDQT
jgi:RNA polymerase-binding transcription factor DksA